MLSYQDHCVEGVFVNWVPIVTGRGALLGSPIFRVSWGNAFSLRQTSGAVQTSVARLLEAKRGTRHGVRAGLADAATEPARRGRCHPRTGRLAADNAQLAKDESGSRSGCRHSTERFPTERFLCSTRFYLSVHASSKRDDAGGSISSAKVMSMRRGCRQRLLRATISKICTIIILQKRKESESNFML